MRRRGAAWVITGVALAVSGCASTQAQGEARPSVTGTVVLPTGAEITSGAEVHVKLIDRTDGKEIGCQSIQRPDAFPVAFDVSYDASALASGHNYAIAASIEVWGETKYKSASPVAVLTQGNPIHVAVQTEATE